MTSKSIYPKSNSEIVKLLKILGFKKALGIGRSKHTEKYKHPKRRNIDPDDRPFIIVTHEYFDANGQRTMKKLRNWGFTKRELEEAYKRM